MRRFAILLDRLAFARGRTAKLRLLGDYFARTPDPDRGYALAALTGALSFAQAKPAVIRSHTMARFGPVREVEKELVCELAFDSAHPSPRHKSGLALRFPRIHRIRWDKPAREADRVETLLALAAEPVEP